MMPRSLFRLLPIAGFAIGAVPQAMAQENYAQWQYSKYVGIRTTAQGANVAGTVRDFPLLVRLGAADSVLFNQALTSGADIRFVKPGTNIRVPHEIESWNALGRSAAVWVLADTVRGNNNTNLRMLWGKADAADSSRAAAVFDTANGFGGVWHMREASGDVSDATSNGNTGANTGTTSVTGIIGPARNFAGGNLANNTATNVQYISVGSPASLDLGAFGSRLTFEAWVRWVRIRPTAGSSFWRTAIFRAGGAISDDEVHLRVDNASPRPYRAGAYVSTVDYGPVSPQGASVYGDSLQWVHLTGVYDSSDANFNIWRLYRNGVQVAEGVPGDQAPIGTGVWYIGGYYANGNTQRRFWAGDLDEIRISKRPRSADWVKLSYETQKAAQTAVVLSDTLLPVVGLHGPRAPRRAEPGLLSATRTGAGVVFRLQYGIARSYRLAVIDAGGRTVWSRRADRVQGPAAQTVFWDGSVRGGARAVAGVYTARATFLNARGKVIGTQERQLSFQP